MAKLSTTSVFGDLLVDGMIHGNVTGNLTGNASTATSATTATSAGKWSTARTITIGSKGKSVDGSANVSWTLDEIGAQSTKRSINFIADHASDWTSSSAMSGKTYAGGWHGNTGTAEGYLSFGNSGNNILHMFVDGDYYARENKKVFHEGNLQPTVAKLATARTLTIGSTGKAFDGSANVSWSLSEIGAAASSHNHAKIMAESGSGWTTATKDVQTDCEFQFASHITQSATGLFARSNNANAIISFNRHSGPHASQLGFSSNGKIYYRAGLGSAITDSTAWEQIYTSVNKPTAADIGAAASSHGTHVTYATATPKAPGTAAIGSVNRVAREDHVHPLQTSVATLTTARTLTIGSTGKTFDGSGNVSWTLAEIGAAASSHSHTSINYQDTRAVNTAAKDVPAGLSIHLKSNGSDGISDGGSYHPVLMMKPWGDKSGWPVGQLAVTQNNNLYFRVSSGADDTSWNAWKKVSLDGHTHSAGGTVTAVNSNLSSVTINSYDSILSGINTNIGKL